MARPIKISEECVMFNMKLPAQQHKLLKQHAKAMSRELNKQVSVADIIRASLDLNLRETFKFIESSANSS